MSAIVTQCAVPENIHTPSTEGILHKFPPPLLPEFPFLNTTGLAHGVAYHSIFDRSGCL